MCQMALRAGCHTHLGVCFPSSRFMTSFWSILFVRDTSSSDCADYSYGESWRLEEIVSLAAMSRLTCASQCMQTMECRGFSLDGAVSTEGRGCSRGVDGLRQSGQRRRDDLPRERHTQRTQCESIGYIQLMS